MPREKQRETKLPNIFSTISIATMADFWHTPRFNAFDIAICVSTTISNGSTSSDIVKWAVKLFHLTIKMKVKSVRCFIFGFVV